MSLILASASPQRRQLLRNLKVPFRVIPSKVEEDCLEKTPRRIVSALALRKARSVAEQKPGSLVLGADTIVVCRGRILIKPRDLEDSRRILGLLNGRWHRVYTGVALVDSRTGKAFCAVALTRVKARRLGGSQLDEIAGKHMDKAGAYAVQDESDPFIERIVGPLDNVIGLPMSDVRLLLKRASRARRGTPKGGGRR